MAKSTDSSTGIKSISKSQKMKGAKLAKQAKLGLVKKHGGVCSSCGQESTSCTPGTSHLGCLGFFQGDFGNDVLNNFAEVGQRAMTADGTVIVGRGRNGTWISKAELRQRREERAAEMLPILKNRVYMTGVFFEPVGKEKPKLSHLTITNGIGEPMKLSPEGWVVVQENPGLTDKVTTDEEAAPIVESDVFTREEIEGLRPSEDPEQLAA